MIAMAVVRGHHKWRSGLITMALEVDTTNAAIKSNSLLPFLPQLGISGECGVSLPAAAADDNDRWLYRRTPSLRPPGSTPVCHSVSFSVRCALHVHCELWKRFVYYPVCHQNIIRPYWTSFLIGRERRDDAITKTAMTSQSLCLQRQTTIILHINYKAHVKVSK